MENSFKPKFPENCKSLVSKYLTDDIYNLLKDKQDKYGYCLEDLVRSGIENPDSQIGIYAGSADTYFTFAPLIDKIIQDYHKHGPTDPHKRDWNSEMIPSNSLDESQKYIISTRIRIARNADQYPLGTCISRQQRLELEKIAIKIFSIFKGKLKGKYYSLAQMTKQEQQQMIKDHFLFQEGDRFLKSAGLNRDWPEGRGIFHNVDKTFLIWLNEEDHFRIISMQKGGNIKQVFVRLAQSVQHIQKTLRFAYYKHYGAITTCPTNLGTGLRASVHIKLPNLAKKREVLQKITDHHYLQIRGQDGEHSDSTNDIFDISNKKRMGISECDLVLGLYQGIQDLIQMEKQLEAQTPKL